MKKLLIFLCVCLMVACNHLSKDKLPNVLTESKGINQNIPAEKQIQLNEQLFAAIDKTDWAVMKAALAAGANINAVSIPPCEGGLAGKVKPLL